MRYHKTRETRKPEDYKTVRISSDTHTQLMKVKGEIETSTGKLASADSVIAKLVTEHKKSS